MSVRTRFAGSAEDLAKVIDPHVDGMKWMKYDDNIKEARVQPELITKHKDLWNSLFEHFETLSFVQTTTEGAMALIRQSKGFELDGDSKTQRPRQIYPRSPRYGQTARPGIQLHYQSQSRHALLVSLPRLESCPRPTGLRSVVVRLSVLRKSRQVPPSAYSPSRASV